MGAATLGWNRAMTWECESRAKCGSREGAALLAQAAEQASMFPGKDGEGSAHTQDRWPRRVSKSQTPKLCEPSGALSHGGAYAETPGTQTLLESLSETGSPQAGGCGDRPEVEAALLWGCLWDCPRIPVLPPWVSQSLSGLSKVSPGVQGLASSAGDTQWQFSLHHSVLYAPVPTAKFPHLDLQPE